MKEFEISIVGGGPAGLQAARTAAENGNSVVVYEKQQEIGIPLMCGEGISETTLEAFNLPIDGDYFRRKIDKMRLFTANGTSFYCSIKGLMIDRVKFDQHLASLAKEAGAEIKTGVKVNNVRTTEKSILEIQTSSGVEEKESEITILAEGPRARITRSLGFKAPRTYVNGYEYHLEGVSTDYLDFYFDLEEFPYGYIWVFPRGENKVNIGIVTSEKQIRAKLDNFMEEKGFIGKKLKTIAGVIPRSGPIPQTYGDRILIAGDAAGLTNPLFYGGIKIAMETGRIAAQTAGDAIQAGDLSSSFLKKYERWRNEPYVHPVLTKAQPFMYEMGNKRFNQLSGIIKNRDITALGVVGSMKVVTSFVRYPWILTSLGSIMRLIKAMRISRKWGY
ncbi:MAG: NAD(P)/FAD-dependent oxidoreductase [Candidatus Heimdallarchaeota archaeon]|nr:NAD(P)/FAD-dependent oxidoreductase [Candidatus Heimdallarchaeota archaeon]MCK5049612.1 NAD(P)/FAD-dependent oxidoreductase [Candidatus Heimdallarchaeota archaeon]